MKYQKLNLHDLILENCPLGCDGKCSEVWVNQITGHRIVCICEICEHTKIESIDKSGDSEFAALSHQTHQQHRDTKLVSQQDAGVLRD